jgi:hypothetical protein
MKKGVLFIFAEDLFQDEVNSKKQIAVNYKAGKRTFGARKILFPSDTMSRKEKYNHRKGGKVVTTNIYDEIIDLNDLLMRSEEEQIRYITEYRKRFTNKQITEAWGKYENYIYQLMEKLGMKPRTKSKTRKAATKKKEEKQEDQVPVPAYLVPTGQVPQTLSVAEEDGFAFKIAGTYSAEKLIKRLEKLSLILDDEESEFEVKILIKEK